MRTLTSRLCHISQFSAASAAIFFSTVGVACAASAGIQNLAVYPYPASGAQIGQGWDSVQERATAASCVTADAVPLEQASYQTEVEEIKSTFSLATKITTSVSASYKGFGFGASASFSSSSEDNIRTDDQNYLFTFLSEFGSTYAVPPKSADNAQFEVSSQTQALMSAAKTADTQNNILTSIVRRPTHFAGAGIKLTDEASKLATSDKSGAKFRESCGDGFVGAIHRGVRIFLLLTQKNASQQQKESLAAALSASGFGASGGASYSTSTDKLSAVDKLTYRVMQQGGTPQAPKALAVNAGSFFDVNTILPTADQLVSNPTGFQVVVIPYSSVGSPIPFNPPVTLKDLGDYYLALNDIWSLVSDLMNAELLGVNASNDGPYEERMLRAYGGLQAIESLHDAIHADLKLIEVLLDACYSGTNCSLPVVLKAATTKAAALTTALCNNSDPNSSCQATSKQFSTQFSALTNSLGKQTTAKSLSELDPNFFLRFYSYLARIPLPRAAYINSSFSDLKATSVPAPNMGEALQNAATELRRAVYSFRAYPWKAFFCKDQKSRNLCVTDDQLHDLIDVGIPSQLPQDYFSAAAINSRPIPPCEMSTGPQQNGHHPIKQCP